MCQNIEKEFPVCILFYICKAEDGKIKLNSSAATDIRRVSVDELKQMLVNSSEQFFPYVYEALKEYVHDK